MFKCVICGSDMREDVLKDFELESVQVSYPDFEVDRAIACNTCTVYGYVSKDDEVVELFME